MVEPDIVGLGVANVDVVLRLEDMPCWEDPGIMNSLALAPMAGRLVRPVWWPRCLVHRQDFSTQLVTTKVSTLLDVTLRQSDVQGSRI